MADLTEAEVAAKLEKSADEFLTVSAVVHMKHKNGDTSSDVTFQTMLDNIAEVTRQSPEAGIMMLQTVIIMGGAYRAAYSELKQKEAK